MKEPIALPIITEGLVITRKNNKPSQKEQKPSIIDLVNEIIKGTKSIKTNGVGCIFLWKTFFASSPDLKKDNMYKPAMKDSSRAFTAENSYPNTFVSGRVSRYRLNNAIINK